MAMSIVRRGSKRIGRSCGPVGACPCASRRPTADGARESRARRPGVCSRSIRSFEGARRAPSAWL